MKVATKIITLLSTVKVLSLVSIIAVGLIYTLYHRKIPDVFNQPFEARDGYVPTASSLSLALYGVLWSYDGWYLLIALTSIILDSGWPHFSWARVICRGGHISWVLRYTY